MAVNRDEATAVLEAADEIWVPDSTLWGARAAAVQLDSAGSMTSSPVVLATNSTGLRR